MSDWREPIILRLPPGGSWPCETPGNYFLDHSVSRTPGTCRRAVAIYSTRRLDLTVYGLSRKGLYEGTLVTTPGVTIVVHCTDAIETFNIREVSAWSLLRTPNTFVGGPVEVRRCWSAATAEYRLHEHLTPPLILLPEEDRVLSLSTSARFSMGEYRLSRCAEQEIPLAMRAVTYMFVTVESRYAH